MQIELAEFAPLSDLRPRFADVRRTLHPREKAKHAKALIGRKSAHKSGTRRLVVIYIMEHGFWPDPNTVERMRRAFQEPPPRIDRVHWSSNHRLTEASISEIYPGKPHHLVANAHLDAGRIFIPYPIERRVVTARHLRACTPQFQLGDKDVTGCIALWVQLDRLRIKSGKRTKIWANPRRTMQHPAVDRPPPRPLRRLRSYFLPGVSSRR